MYERETTYISIASAFLLGGLIGAGIALLMAPQSGADTRHLIRNRSMELKDKAVETAQETRHQAEKKIEDVTHQAKDRAQQLKERGKDLASH